MDLIDPHSLNLWPRDPAMKGASAEEVEDVRGEATGADRRRLGEEIASARENRPSTLDLGVELGEGDVASADAEPRRRRDLSGEHPNSDDPTHSVVRSRRGEHAEDRGPSAHHLKVGRRLTEVIIGTFDDLTLGEASCELRRVRLGVAVERPEAPRRKRQAMRADGRPLPRHLRR